MKTLTETKILDFILLSGTSNIHDLFIWEFLPLPRPGATKINLVEERYHQLTAAVILITLAIMDNTIITHDFGISHFNGSLKLDKVLGVALIVREYNKISWISSVIYNSIKQNFWPRRILWRS